MPFPDPADDVGSVIDENARLREQLAALQADRGLLYDALRRKPERLDDRQIREELRLAIRELDKQADRLKVFVHVILVSGGAILGAMFVLAAMIIKGFLL